MDLAPLEKALLEAAYWRGAELARAPGNPLEVEERRFGRVLARRICRELAYYRYFSGPLEQLGAEDASVLGELVGWYRSAQAPLYLRLPSWLRAEPLETALIAAGLAPWAELSVLFATADTLRSATVADVRVEERRDRFIDLWATDEVERGLARLEFEHWRTFIALVGDVPVAHGALFVSTGTRCAVLGAAATRPDFQRRGGQSALIARRAADAFAAGCERVAVEASPGSQSERNLVRLGFQPGYRRALWTWAENA